MTRIHEKLMIMPFRELAYRQPVLAERVERGLLVLLEHPDTTQRSPSDKPPF